MPRLGNQVCVVQWLDVNAHGVDGTMIQLDTGTQHGQLAPSCIWIWWILTSLYHVNEAQSTPPYVPQIQVINWSQWAQPHNHSGIDTVSNIRTAGHSRQSESRDPQLYLYDSLCCHPLINYTRQWLSTRLW